MAGEWSHGWQFHATRSLDRYRFNILLRRFGLSSSRINARSVNKTRLYSCCGAYAASWLLTCPCSDSLSLSDDQFRCSMKYRLGLAIIFKGRDTHGHFKLASSENGRTNARHTSILHAWRQIFVEAGGKVPRSQ